MFKRCVGLWLVTLCCLSCSSRPLSDVGKPQVANVDLQRYPAHFGAFIVLNDYFQELEDFEKVLRASGVADVVAVNKLWLQGSEWQSRQHSAYALPAPEKWPAMVKTLQFLKYELLPLTGPVEILSGYRTSAYNQAAGGARQSRHVSFSALDLRPRRKISRYSLHRRMRKLWRTRGKKWDLGLGLYSGLRLHIDTGGYRTWQN